MSEIIAYHNSESFSTAYEDLDLVIRSVMNTFRGRQDVVGESFVSTTEPGRPKYRPICANRDQSGICVQVGSPKYPCGRCLSKTHSGLNENLIRRHIEGEIRLGIYPLLPNGTCYFIAADFDNHDGLQNPYGAVLKAHEAFSFRGLASYALKSKSGKGYHLYIFFEEAVPAKKARQAYQAILDEAGIKKGNGYGYDRLFPSQDEHRNDDSIGSLIALPFHGSSVQEGNTLFLDPAILFEQPFENQIEILEGIQRTTEAQLDQIIGLKEAETESDQIPTSKRIDKLSYKDLSVIPEGQRNDVLASLAGSLRSTGLDQETIEVALLRENQNKCKPPLDEDEVRRIAAGISRYAPGQAALKNLTDLGNAERFAASKGENVRYCAPQGMWFFWNGKVWSEDEIAVRNNAYETVRSIMKEKETARTEKEKARIARHALSSESYSRIDAMLKIAQNLPPISIGPEQWNTDPWLLNCENGTLDLKKGELRPHNRYDLFQVMVPVAYDQNAKCPGWLEFLHQIFAGNKDLIDFMKRLVGYTLTGDTREEKIFILHGDGANGKSTFLEVVRAMLGNYSKQANFESFIQHKTVSVRQDLARLVGSRFVTASEVEKGSRLAEVIIKQITGGEPITARYLYEKDFEFAPEFKLFLATNDIPVIKGKDKGIWRRISLINFGVTIEEDKQDKELKGKLFKELPGILSWAVEGCLEWQQFGLAEPEEVKRVTACYRMEMDSVARFISEMCERDGSKSIKKGDIYYAYSSWCVETGEELETKKSFGSSLKRMGIEDRKKNAEWYWTGIGLQSEFPPQPETANPSDPYASS